MHLLTIEELKEWSALRVVLDSFGWIARRVEQSAVPHHSIVLCVFKFGSERADTNSLGLIGGAGMIPLRGSKLHQRWGDFGQSRFIPAAYANIAESEDERERLLQGLPGPIEISSPAL